MVRIGSLKRQITFQKNTPVTDGAGGFTDTWTDDKTVYCSIIPNNSTTDKYEFGVAVIKQGFTCLIRYNDYTPVVNGQVKYNDDLTTRYLQINSLTEINDGRRYWQMKLTEAKNG
jgi:head-tail adaptor